MTPAIGSLCSGYGGLDLAVEAFYGARTAWFCEIDPKAASVFAAHWPGVPNLRDVKLTHFGRVPRVDILTAGYPCQPFSHAGRRNGIDDPRHLWPYIAQAVRRIRPRHVVLENVAGHRSMGFDVVLGDLAAFGYDVRWTSLRAADIGAPHGRERIFIVAEDADRATGDQWRVAAPGQAQGGRPRSDAGRSGRAHTPADTEGQQQRERVVGLGERPEPRRSAGPATDADGYALREQPITIAGRGSETFIGLPDSAATDATGNGRNGRTEATARGRADRDGSRSEPARPVQWGQYEPAIRRWERLTRIAPAPTELSPEYLRRRARRLARLDTRPVGRRGSLAAKYSLAPRFVEWMQGLPAGWVCNVPGLSRNDMLRILGNGVVPQQALEAQRRLSTIEPLVGAA